jgi:transposase
MTRSERECLAKGIVQHYVNIANRQKKITVNHFLQERIPRRNIYYIIKKFEEFGAVGDRPRTGRPKKLSKQKLTRLKRLFDHKAGISLRQVVPKFDVHITTISRNLKAMGITYRKKKRAPKYNDKQVEEIPTRARRLYRTLLNDNVELVMDDEKYFLLHNESTAANRGFYTSDPSTTPSAVKFKRTQKFAPKILVWIAISENGISTPFFA